MKKVNALNSNDSSDVKLKTKDDLNRKEFFDTKDNKYRVKKLISLGEILLKPDFDIELDELKFTKLKKYKDYSLVKLTEPELKKILLNYDMKEESYINFLGITKLDEKTYSLQLDLFLDKFIRINLKEVTFEENLDVIFKIYDKDKNGSISKTEFLELISYFNQINLLAFDNSTTNIIGDAIFKEIDKSKAGSISKQVLGKYLEKYKDEDITINPFVKVKTSDKVTKLRKQNSIIISPEQERELERITRKKDRSKIKKFWVLNKKMVIWTCIYIALCIITGLINRSLEKGRQYSTTKAARFFAGIIYFNLALLLLFMCITTITFVSTTCLKFYLPLSDTKFYHSVCGSVLGITSIIHILIHILGDFVEIAKKCATQPAKKYVTVAWLTFANLTGLTGVFASIIFCVIIIVPLIPTLRNNHYELFLYTHKLFYLGIIIVLLHANTPDTKRWTFLFVMSLPLFLYLIEIIFRVIRYCLNKTTVLRVKYLKSGVILLDIKKPKNFKYRCGQYAQINIPQLSKWQWHPFTFASSPSDDTIFFYINPVGDWTKDLKTLGKKEINQNDLSGKTDSFLAKNNNEEIVYPTTKNFQTNLIIRYVDGPFGAPAEQYKNYVDLIFVASGVGSTPFSSILISILYQLKLGEKLKYKSISFYWIQREYIKTDYLNNLLEEIVVEDLEKICEVNIFITGAQQKYDCRSLFLAEGIEIAKKDAKGKNFDHICSGNVFWGRPEWDVIFKKKTLNFRHDEETKVGVFVCGNYALVDDIYEVCENYSSAAVKYELNTEHF